MEINEHRLEQLKPREIYAELNRKSIVYLPLGALEWHGLHLPIGLDSMTSHALCLRTAEEIGGLVMPPLYYGMTGSIGHHPWTILIEKEETLLGLLRDTLQRLDAFNVKLAVIFTGHFGRRQLAALEKLEQDWNSEEHDIRLICLSINACPEASMRGDHGAIFETSLLMEIDPDLVDLERLPDVNKYPASDPDGDSWGSHRRETNNVLFGILGDDPRQYNKEKGKELYKTILSWFIKSIKDLYETLY